MIKKLLTSVAFVLSLSAGAALANDVIGKVETSGWVFKDTIEITAFDDPTIKGIACYVTQPARTLSLEDPSNSSIACRQVGPISGDLKASPNLFSASKNLFFKAMRVDRFFDAKRNVLVYISYTTKTSGDNHSHSVSVVPVAK